MRNSDLSSIDVSAMPQASGMDLRIMESHIIELSRWTILISERPWWRLWWNQTPGAFVHTAEESIELTRDTVVLVAPETTFTVSMPDKAVQHGYAHFSMGQPWDSGTDQIVRAKLSPTLQQVLKRGLQYCKLLDLMQVIGHALSSGAFHLRAARSLPPDIGRLCASMEADPGYAWSNDILAERIHLSTGACIRKFSQTVGVSPMRWLRKQRLAHARFLLEHTDDSIDSIAADCGFAHRAHFANAFKLAVYIPPAKWRALARGGDATR